MKVRIECCSYKPIHGLYLSLQVYPPQGVEYIFPEPQRFLECLHPIHRRIGDTALGQLITAALQRAFLHYGSEGGDGIDLYHFAVMVSEDLPPKPYVVDFGHIAAPANFSKLSSSAVDRIAHLLGNSREIIPISLAAQGSPTDKSVRRCRIPAWPRDNFA